MKFTLLVKHAGGDTVFEEDYDKSRRELVGDIGRDCAKLSDRRVAEIWGRWIVAWYNSGLRGKERAREYIRTTLVDAAPDAAPDGPKHDWYKTNLVTVAKRTGASMSYFDEMKCRNCGMTGRRGGLGEHVSLDAKYRKTKVYQRCDTAKAHLEKRAKK